jgi:Na+-translocating ferredoxin:NAD+ oxidoreductase subunit B
LYNFPLKREAMMDQNIYIQLANALDRLPNGFTRTESQVELKILQKIFSPEEAVLACQLSGTLEHLDDIAQRAGRSAREVSKQLFKMARRGLIWIEKQDGKVCFRLAPFIVGIYEAQVELMDHELAHLVEDYLTGGGANGIMKPQPALHRVVPASRSIKSEWILPYDDVRAIILEAKSFTVRDCICRVQQDHIGRKCDFPLDTCLSFTNVERPLGPGDITREQALAILDKSEEIGLVHSVSNVMQGVGYVCNCCGCCCGILRGVTEWGIEYSMAHANYYAVIEPLFCSNCGTCRERCQVSAITEGDGVSVVERTKCIGCGLCVTGCSSEAATLIRKPDAEMIHPPKDFAAWEHERLYHRGLAAE